MCCWVVWKIVCTACAVYFTAEVLRGPQEVQRSSETLRRQGRDRTVQLWARGSTESRTKPAVQVPLIQSRVPILYFFSQLILSAARWNLALCAFRPRKKLQSYTFLSVKNLICHFLNFFIKNWFNKTRRKQKINDITVMPSNGLILVSVYRNFHEILQSRYSIKI